MCNKESIVLAICGLVVVVWPTLSVAGDADVALSGRNTEVPFCYVRSGVRTWPILQRRLEKDEALTLTARRKDEVLGSGRTIQLDGVSVSVAEGVLAIDARTETRESAPLTIELEVALQRGGQTVQSQRLQVRPAPPPRPISYIADLVDDLLRIFAEPEAGRFKPISKDGFDQYFRRLQAHGVSRLIVWHSPFPYFTRPEDHDPEHWRRYERQARAIIDNADLEQAIRKRTTVGPADHASKSLPSWLWLRFVMALRLNPEAGPMFVQSAADHDISLTASFRPFESALTKYYEVPTFDSDGDYLWGFLPLAMPVVNYQPERVCFGHYRQVLADMGRPEFGRVAAIELPGLPNADIAPLVEQFGPTGGFELRAARFPPIAADSFVLVRQPDGQFQLRPYRDIRDAAEVRRTSVRGLLLAPGPDGHARLTGVDVSQELRFLSLSHVATPSDKAAASITLDKEVPVRLRAQAGNRLNRETIYWVFDESTPAGRDSRIAGITPDGEYRAVFQACTSSINSLLAQPQRISLAGNAIVMDRGDLWSVEMLDFQQPAARQMAVTQLKSLFGLRVNVRGTRPEITQPAYDEIFINTRSHVDLAPTMADGDDGQQLIAKYIQTRRWVQHHLGLDKAYAPRAAADDGRLRAACDTPLSVERITAWQDGEWRESCQAPDSPFIWRLARNRAVADGVTRLLRDLEHEFPKVRIRAVIPPREEYIQRIQQALDVMPTPRGGTYGKSYYRNLWCSNNHAPAIGEGMALVDLTGTRVEPVLLGSGASQPDRAPFELFVRELIADLSDNRGSQFRGPRSYFYEGQFTLRATDLADARKFRESTIRHLLSHRGDIGEVLLYESADWLFFLPLSDPDLCGHSFLDQR